MHLGGHTTHTYTHTCIHIHTHFHARFYHTHTPHFYTLLHTLLSRTSLRHTFVAHADSPPSLFSFLHFPSHLYLSFAANWKKLTCGVIRSSNLFFFVFVLAFSFVVFFGFSCLYHIVLGRKNLLSCYYVLVDVLVVPLAVDFREWFDWNRYHLTALRELCKLDHVWIICAG